jgi:hypothetical protein
MRTDEMLKLLGTNDARQVEVRRPVHTSVSADPPAAEKAHREASPEHLLATKRGECVAYCGPKHLDLSRAEGDALVAEGAVDKRP